MIEVVWAIPHHFTSRGLLQSQREMRAMRLLVPSKLSVPVVPFMLSFLLP